MMALLESQEDYLAPAPEWSPQSTRSFTRGNSVHDEVIRYAAFVRNLNVESISARAYRISDGSRAVSFWGHIPDTTSLVARLISNSKDITKGILRGAGLSVPDGSVFERDQEDEAWAFARTIGLPVVVKPTHGYGGRGVTSNIEERRHFALAWKVAQDFASTQIIVERHIHGRDFRLFVVGDQLRAAIWRVPAYIEGDGETSIEGLIERKNQSRRPNPYVGAKPIRLTPVMLRHLEDQGLRPDSIPSLGRRVSLHLVANIGGGGESVDVTEDVHPDFADIAVRTCKALPGAIHCGVDLLVEDIAHPASRQTWAICEINTNPDIAMHHFPVAGRPRDAAGALIEHLFPGSRPVDMRLWERVHIEVAGPVDGVGFGRWLRRAARLRGLTGWVRSGAEDRVEAVLCGPSRTVENVVSLCRIGPDRTEPREVAVSEYRGRIPPRFAIRT
ncbi:acylphosphatase [Microvirga makkahensis]|uniref:ATP-grasp domain-containing protein n=1 Tax=Microvirga makkahensis TaxID=1128670 RepID=A0A7X3SRE3_9HYPH|nr:acylphosphatase [Microvirga makkahensis]MXQ14253.1 ATP-grasp domain-containing protein [Microvirga makkahensis]